MYDRDIVEAILASDPAGFAAAYDRYGATLYAYCRSLLTGHEEAGNAVRDTFIIAIARLPHLRDPDRLRPWLYAIARNECHRQLHDRAAADIVAETNQAATQDLDAGADVGESGPRELVGAALAALEPVIRDIAELSLRHELDDDGLAALLGVSRKQARAMAAHACQQFEASLGALVTSGADWSLCQDLGSLLAGWNGEMTAALRRRLTEHIKACGVCGVRRTEPLLEPGLWPGRPLVPRPRADPDAGPPAGEWWGPRHGSRPRRGSGPRHGSRPGSGRRPVPDGSPAPGGRRGSGSRGPTGGSPVRGSLPGRALPGGRMPGSSLEPWPGIRDPWSRPRDTRPGSLPGPAGRRAIGPEAEGAADGTVGCSDIAEHAGPFGKSGFPVPMGPPRPYRAPVRSVLALAGVSALAILGVAAMVTATVHEGAGSRGPVLGLPGPGHSASRHAGVPGAPRQTPAGVVPAAAPPLGTSPPVPATIRSSRSASAEPTVIPGTLAAFPATVTLQQSSKGGFPTGSFTLSANDGPVSFTIVVPAGDDLTVTPDTGSLPAGQGVQITVTLRRRNGPPLNTHLNVEPDNLDITVTWAHSR
jgi:RNA polymerase sigma factor (sigma-70 family)